jgi:8-oxo-dGTP pyrophosphatase MutT (NUDIX family)
MAERWKPSVTVAAVVERLIDGENRYLLVEERTDEGLRLNNPAGHLDAGESLEQAVAREVLEETACRFSAQGLVGVYLWRSPRSGGDASQDITYLRFAFCGTVSEPDHARALDTGIVRTLWMTIGEVHASRARHRSPLVQRCIDDYRAGVRYPLQLLHAYPAPGDPAAPG